MLKKLIIEAGINITDQRITNHSGRRTAIQLLSDLNVNEHEMIQFSGHYSTDRLCTYKIHNNEQWLKNSTLLLNALQEFSIVQQRESEQEKSQVMQQDESQVMQQEESQVMQQEESQIMQQEKFQVIQPDESQATQYKESQVMQHDVQITQHKEFQTTQQVIQDNSSVMQHEFNSTATQVLHQIIHKKKPKLTHKEIQAKLNKPFRISFKNIQDQTQQIEIAEDQTAFKNVQDQTQHIKMKRIEFYLKIFKINSKILKQQRMELPIFSSFIIPEILKLYLSSE
ncbi:23144_t:CDS:2 [Gigaspora margarita]|uniref:23144_t:CDS:1 n=1 Tax=Gigaspora margarita TaxID=4874 RepID=A0ABN7UNZ1_GIGMA|nr:23144_t:CDS:2 [Gigaspora margarita]